MCEFAFKNALLTKQNFISGILSEFEIYRKIHRDIKLIFYSVQKSLIRYF